MTSRVGTPSSIQSISNQSIHTIQLSDTDLQHLYSWVDSIPLSRPKRNINRDFSDGILLSEIIHFFYPKLIDLHNYSTANNSKQKMYNLNTLNQRVLKKHFKFQLDQEVMEDIVACKPGTIEKVLYKLKLKMATYTKDKRDKEKNSDKIESKPPPPPLYDYGSTFNLNQNEINGLQSSLLDMKLSEGPFSNGKENNECGGNIGPRFMTKNKDLKIQTDNSILLEKEATIRALNEKNQLLLATISKLEQLLKVKDARISKLQEDLHRKFSSSVE